jgi:putative hydrolase
MYERNTTMVLNALEKNKIDVLTHLNSKMKCDVVAVAKKAAEKGTLIELNERHCDFSKSEIDGMLEVGANFIVNSDSHKPEKIGVFNKVEKIIRDFNIPENRIVNLDNLPEFLSLKTKK